MNCWLHGWSLCFCNARVPEAAFAVDATRCTICGYVHDPDACCFEPDKYSAWLDGETQMRDERAVKVDVQ